MLIIRTHLEQTKYQHRQIFRINQKLTNSCLLAEKLQEKEIKKHYKNLKSIQNENRLNVFIANCNKSIKK